ncbi:MAG: cytochrome-c peroxidase [Candidatus Berkiellales bacterium]
MQLGQAIDDQQNPRHHLLLKSQDSPVGQGEGTLQQWKFKVLLLICVLAFPSLGSTATYDAIQPISYPPNPDPKKIDLGKKLYSDPLFSKNNFISCATCHSLNKGGCDNLPRYIGIDQKEGDLNTPTVLNAILNFRQFWDGRAKTLEQVIDDHVANETIFANQWPEIVRRVQQNVNTLDNFKQTYSDGVTADNIKDALTTFLAILVTPRSPFDLYLGGNKSALSSDAQKGYQLFKQYGCITCHQGPNMGGNLILPLGIYKNYYANKGHITKADLGYFNVTGNPENKYEFKVPTLRNIALTAPYLHDGSAKTLEDVIKVMGEYEVGQPIPVYEIPYIVKFLESLTGTIPRIAQDGK